MCILNCEIGTLSNDTDANATGTKAIDVKEIGSLSIGVLLGGMALDTNTTFVTDTSSGAVEAVSEPEKKEKKPKSNVKAKDWRNACHPSDVQRGIVPLQPNLPIPTRLSKGFTREDCEALKEFIRLARNAECTNTIEEMMQLGAKGIHHFRCLNPLCGYEWDTSRICVVKLTSCKKCSRKYPLSYYFHFIDSLKQREKPIRSLSTPEELYKKGVSGKSWYECLAEGCGHKWQTITDIVLRDNGCPECKYKQLSYYLEEIAKLPLREKRIRALTTAEEMKKLTTHGKATFECLMPGCDYVWDAQIRSIFSGGGCDKCRNKKPPSHYKLQIELLAQREKPIKVNSTIEEMYMTGVEGIHEFRCLNPECGETWNASLSQVFNTKTGCSHCWKMTKTYYSEQIELLSQREKPIKSFSTAEEMHKAFGGTYALHKFGCLMPGCDHEWYAALREVFAGSGCEKCSRKYPLSYYFEQIDLLLKRKQPIRALITAEEMYIGGNHSHHWFECLVDGCGEKWRAKLVQLFVTQTGCPYCHDRKKYSDQYTGTPYSFVASRCEFTAEEIRTDGRFNIVGIRAVMDERNRLARETGKNYQVDHIVPVSWCNRSNMDEVVALNNPINLRAITRQANQEKRNYLTDESLHEIILNPQLFKIYKIASRKPLDVILRVNAYISNLVELNDRRIFLALYPHLTYLLEEYDRMYIDRRSAA